MPADELLAAAEALPVPPDSGREGDWSMMVNWVPCVDGRFITDQYAHTIARGEQNEVEILLGNTTGEFMEPDADGTPLPAGEVGNLKLIAEWIRSGRKAPYYYRFDVAMPGTMPEPSTPRTCGSSFGTLGTCWRPFCRLALRPVSADGRLLDELRRHRRPERPRCRRYTAAGMDAVCPIRDDAHASRAADPHDRDWSTNAERNALLQWGSATTN